MKSFPVEYNQEALEDIASIFRSVLKVSENFITAKRFTDRIYAQCEKIGDMPYGGAPRDYLCKGYVWCLLKDVPSFFIP